MRLAQIARKVKVKPTEIRAFVKTKFDLELDKDPNIKLEDEQVKAILENFKIEEIIEEPVVEEVVVEEIIEEIEIDPSIDTDLDALKEVVAAEVNEEEKVEIPEVKVEVIEDKEESKPEVVEKTVAKKAVGIKHADPEELTELKANKEDDSSDFKSAVVDEDADLIAAEVQQLDGLKVVGKIELEDDKETKKLLNEEVELPTSDAVENEIDNLDGDLDTSEFEELGEGEPDEKKDAIFADLDAAMDSSGAGEVKAVKPVKAKAAAQVSDNVDEEEDSLYKDSRGIYSFTSEQRENRRKSVSVKQDKLKARLQKEKKARHYKETVAQQAPIKKKKEPSKKAIAKQESVTKKKEAPKSFWGKFKNWINDRD